MGLFSLFSRSAETTDPSAVPDDTIVYAIGDIHGRADLLKRLEIQIVEDAASQSASRRILIYLGDYVDRGMQSKQVLDHLLAGAPAGFEPIYLKGNHEEAFQTFLSEPEFGPNWRDIGGHETIASYGVSFGGSPVLTLDSYRDACQRLRAAVPQAHLDFMMWLPSSYEIGDYFFAHAGVRPSVPLAEQTDKDLLWIRDAFLDYRGTLEKVVVHGHTPTEKPEVRKHRIGIDTGAFITNKLTALVLCGTDRRFLAT